eukprot:scaffold192424_cov33-Tisochrysis_lutea.AAC.6
MQPRGKTWSSFAVLRPGVLLGSRHTERVVNLAPRAAGVVAWERRLPTMFRNWFGQLHSGCARGLPLGIRLDMRQRRTNGSARIRIVPVRTGKTSHDEEKYWCTTQNVASSCNTLPHRNGSVSDSKTVMAVCQIYVDSRQILRAPGQKFWKVRAMSDSS